MKERYSRNIPAISENDMAKLLVSHILVVGCGGLGGYIIEYLARLGVGKLTIVDGDSFSESNLNRQLLSDCNNIGKLKTSVARERVQAINPNIELVEISEFLTQENAAKLLKDVDIVMDALDNVQSRLILEDAAEFAGVPIVHGAIDGWSIQAALVKPGSRLLHQLYSMDNSNNKSALSFTPAVCAGVQVSAAVCYLCERASSLDGKLFISSLKNMDSDLISFQ